MGAVGPFQLLLLVVVALLLFGGRGRIANIMGDLASGIKSFRKGLAEEEGEDKKAVEGDDIVNITPQKDKAESKS